MGSDQLDAQLPDLLIHCYDHFFRQEEQIKGPAKAHAPVTKRLFGSKLFQLLHELFGNEIAVWGDFGGPGLEAWRESVTEERSQTRRGRCGQGFGGVVWRIYHVGVVNHESRPSIDCFEAATELAPEDVFGSVAKALQVALGYVVEQRVIGESSFQLRLPQMVVGVDEAGRHDLLRTIDCLGLRTGCDGGSDLLDDVAFDQDIGVSQRGHTVILLVDEHRSAL